ncbi:Transglutaminase-like enzyme, putative cysteine protease [Halogranum amylolyticum]|uniref:Transglutaminase-like enzyme, putative cysteine protease n=1 Tax=Halogranum amylolyticum TaxID=660520 RepID=A0A1H8TS01_9EURY|nr:transglutaminaseTgpA domain-containing protein [Halogranum amylolyticum]SEO93616.1 Transglutaminase-like enzyme, putative cysteine protease [Halogranum amylolyticum]
MTAVSRDGEGGGVGGESGFDLRQPALLGVVALTLSYLSVLYHVTDVVGGSTTLLLVVGATLALATVLGRFLRVRSALVLTALILGGGLAAYFFSVPASNRALFTVERVVSDTVALLTGLSVLRLTKAGTWALAIAPGPVFLSWYLAVRRKYVWSVVVGGGALVFFVLTGDAGTTTTLFGVVGAAAAVGLATLGDRSAWAAQLDTLALVLAAMVVLSATLSVVPGGAAQPLLQDRGSPTVESSLVSSNDQVNILGSIRLSPEVRFEVRSDSREYWQTAAYDRYTGDGWVRSGEDEAYSGRLGGPPGSSRTVVQNVEAKTQMSALPAAWRPVKVDGISESSLRVTHQGSVVTTETLETNDSFQVRSEVPRYTREQLRRSGDDYPDRVAENYLQLPGTTSDRVREQAAEIAGNETNAYDKARAIERYLESSKEYSLTVQRPDGDITESFLFEMDAGYCTYYATSMVVMLRSQGVPARFVTGYTSGQQVADDKYVVRGLDSHAWVQIYFPEVGWVDFDPTPGDARENAENARLEEARQNQAEGVDTDETTPETPTPGEEDTETPTPGEEDTETSTPGEENATNQSTTNRSTLNPNRILSDAAGGGSSAATSPVTTPDSSGGLPSLPSRETLGVGLALMVGLAAGARRTGATTRVARFVWMYYQGARRDPTTDTERAFGRLEYLLERQYRPRRPRETPRSYLTALSKVGLDERATEVGRLYERAHYGPGVSRDEADRAIELVDELVREQLPVVGRRRN